MDNPYFTMDKGHPLLPDRFVFITSQMDRVEREEVFKKDKKDEEGDEGKRNKKHWLANKGR